MTLRPLRPLNIGLIISESKYSFSVELRSSELRQPSEFQNRRATATLTSSANGNPFRTLPKGNSLAYGCLTGFNFLSSEPTPRETRQGNVGGTTRGSATSRGGASSMTNVGRGGGMMPANMGMVGMGNMMGGMGMGGMMGMPAMSMGLGGAGGAFMGVGRGGMHGGRGGMTGGRGGMMGGRGMMGGGLGTNF